MHSTGGPVKSGLGTHQLAPDVSVAGQGRVSIRQLPVAARALFAPSQKVPKLTPCAHGEATDHATVGDEHVRTRCAARGRCRPPRRATLHRTMAPLRCTVSVLLVREWLLEQCTVEAMRCQLQHCGNTIAAAGVCRFFSLAAHCFGEVVSFRWQGGREIPLSIAFRW